MMFQFVNILDKLVIVGIEIGKELFVQMPLVASRRCLVVHTRSPVRIDVSLWNTLQATATGILISGFCHGHLPWSSSPQRKGAYVVTIDFCVGMPSLQYFYSNSLMQVPSRTSLYETLKSDNSDPFRIFKSYLEGIASLFIFL